MRLSERTKDRLAIATIPVIITATAIAYTLCGIWLIWGK